MKSSLDCLIPRPVSIEAAEGTFGFAAGVRTSVAPLAALLERFGVAVNAGGAGVIELADAAMPADGFEITITPQKMTIAAGDAAGRMYGINAAEQLLWNAFAVGADAAKLACGHITDYPRLKYRGVMLDSARHMQSAETIRELLKSMARLRLNVFHWHLTDGDGWRAPSAGAPKLNTLAARQAGCYTAEEIRSICELAEELHIQVVPELDLPGHSIGLLSLYTHLRCHEDIPSHELCLGNPETAEFMKARLDEFMALFPNSKIIHLGGDECWVGGWKSCEKCQAKYQELGLTDYRQLEAWFITEMVKYVEAHGRRAMVWNSEAVMPPGVLSQEFNDPMSMWRLACERTNEVVSSICGGFYLDYPQNVNDPHEPWMTMIDEQAIYLAEPAAHMGDALKERLVGVEAPLWTEIVPDWRVRAKLFPRIIAVAENGWIAAAEKDWQDYKRRKEVLEAVGYTW